MQKFNIFNLGTKMNQTIYVSSPESQQIYVWKLNEFKEQLELIQIICTLGNVQPLTIHPNQQFLYAGVRPNFGIITYRINQDGLLNEIKTTKIPNRPTYLVVNTTGTSLYCASYNDNAISVITIDKFGMISSLIQIINELLGCHSVNINKNKKILWVPCLQEHTIKLFNIHPITGILIAHNPEKILIKAGSGPRHMIFHESDNYSYVINELNGTINVIQYNLDTIVPIVIQTIKILPNHSNIKNFWSSDIHITPDNHWLYCSDRFFHTISCFEVCAQSKTLKFMYFQHTEEQPRSFAIDNTGKFLIVAGQKSHHITLYRINIDNGQLYVISRYPSGTGPTWISICPSY